MLSCQLYSFELVEVSKSQSILRPGERLRITGKVWNNGFRLGTIYVVIKLSDAYDHSTVLFDSDRDLDASVKQTLRIVDIPISGSKIFCCDFLIPETCKRGVLDVKFQIWTPDKLFSPPNLMYAPYVFHETKWAGFVELITPEAMTTKIFVSYSWESPEHLKWVSELSEELSRYNINCVVSQKDLHAGEEITRFMEESLTDIPVCIAVCSSSYTHKANRRSDGVGYEITILTNEILNGRPRFTVIPVVKDNPAKKMPDCFGSAKYIDMESHEWRAEPLLKLVAAINRSLKKLN